LRPIPPPEKLKEELLLFFKLYEPSSQKLQYVLYQLQLGLVLSLADYGSHSKILHTNMKLRAMAEEWRIQ
jgi:hypothetical protein